VALAQHNLGALFAEGRGVPQDDVEAARWYRLAADQGYPAAQYNLASMLFEGRGVAQDLVAALMWFNLAADQLTAPDRFTYAQARDRSAEEMTAEQVAEAERLAREWKPTTPVQ
jgi:hypothetical protein